MAILQMDIIARGEQRELPLECQTVQYDCMVHADASDRFQPQRSESAGTTCFLREMTPGRNAL